MPKSALKCLCLAGCFADARPQPDIPSRAVRLSLVLGEVVHIPSLLQ
jgi:hypothetical protein